MYTGDFIHDLIQIADRVKAHLQLQQLQKEANMKLIRIHTDRGRSVLVPPSDLEIKVCADGYVRSQTSFGPITEHVLPFFQVADINAGEFPEYDDGGDGPEE